MININRDVNSPKSLLTQEIKDYIDLAVEYLKDPDNVIKPEKPASYRSSDLLDSFDNCFYSKCYLTEQLCANSYIMDIEHFIPQSERPDLIYEWTNLYPAEHYTNMIKPRITPVGGYLDPCNPLDDVESEIVYTLSPMGDAPDFLPYNPGNLKAVNTCSLLSRVHNGHDNPTIKATLTLRHAIQKKYIYILNKIIEWKNAIDGSQEKFQLKREIKDLISRKSSYTMLCRSIPAVRTSLDDSFFD